VSIRCLVALTIVHFTGGDAMTVSYRNVRALLLFAIFSCSGFVLTEHSGFADLDGARLSALVGGHHQCCQRGLKTPCASVAPFACISTDVSCDTTPTGSKKDSCAAATCKNSTTQGDECNLASRTDVPGKKCTPTSTTPDPCGDNMHQCPYTQTDTTLAAITCGSSSLCTSGQPSDACP
jgi:hypothetical protein